ncbi:hypothetical protein [Cupriavidus taiwanensis]|uniref:hypothetical protein n=1 Tax=Cupriavidus taiwanensis TaxID=164546 RepID=UPI000E193E8D|nr:hypothetical protein [Cupriavidus taiwanensis]SPA17229.1 hypothetical protein CBM2631_A90305 [Cupriavidus taiwanensis]
MFSLTLTNDNEQPVSVAYGNLKFTKDGIDPLGVEEVELLPHEALTVQTEETGRISAVLSPARTKPDEAAPFLLTIENVNDNAVRVEYGDQSGELDERTINAGDVEQVVALATWRITASLMGVGDATLPNDGFTQGNA